MNRVLHRPDAERFVFQGSHLLLKVTMFCVVGLVAGVGHYWLVGPPSLSPFVGLLAGLGGVAYIDFEARSRR